MAKTITVRIDDKVYDLFRRAADGQKRTISNFLEYATLNYIVNDSVVDDQEMEDILQFETELNKGLSDLEEGRYTIVG